jgi:ectoine hydroxylase-related dioxygenase (phytanoyl-CoA dioxygenase family)
VSIGSDAMRAPLHQHATFHTDLQQSQPQFFARTRYLKGRWLYKQHLSCPPTSVQVLSPTLSHAARRQRAPPTTPAYHLQLSKPRSLQRCESINTIILLHTATSHPARPSREFRIVPSKDRCCCRRILLRRQLLKLQSSGNHESLTNHRQLACRECSYILCRFPAAWQRSIGYGRG